MIDDHTRHGDDKEIDLIRLFRVIWNQRVFISLVTTISILFSVIYSLNLDNIYTATVTMLPQANEVKGNKFSGIAALAGIDISNSNYSNEAFYADVLKSDKILNNLVSKKWQVGLDNKEVFLYDFLEIDTDYSHISPEDKLLFDTKKYLKDKVIKFSNIKTNGIMFLSISIPRDASLSSSIANWVVKELHKFNEEYREKKSLENLNIIKVQLKSAKNELNNAENNLSRFLKFNKKYFGSPELELEYNRLQREVLTESTVYIELRKQYEIAKIDFEKSKETIIILDSAVTPMQKSGPNRPLICFLITTFFFSIAVVYVVIKGRI